MSNVFGDNPREANSPDDGALFLAEIDKHIEAGQDDGFRGHLGASLIGGQCPRALYYTHRWATKQVHSAQLLRLFNRGHLEEFRFEEWIKPVCDQFWPIHPDTGEQIRISDFDGHFGGSLDGVVRNPKPFVGDYLTEFKTHNLDSFVKLVSEGVQKSKPEHYSQMQIYLEYNAKLIGAFYFAICKNNDKMYCEYVPRDQAHAAEKIAVAEKVLTSEGPPDRPSWAKETYFHCKHFCNHTELCYGHQAPHVTCRSCRFFELEVDTNGVCGKTGEHLSVPRQKQACEDYQRLF